jgi:hypothetical protein
VVVVGGRCLNANAHAKILNPRTTPSVVLNSGGKKNNKKRKNKLGLSCAKLRLN